MTPVSSRLARARVRCAAGLATAAAMVLVGPAAAEAHLHMTQPKSRYGSDILKSPPCGMGDGPRTENVTVYEPGQTIEVVWNEYVDHPSHYRIAFDPDGDDDFVDPKCLDKCDNYGEMVIEEYSNDAVLLDGIEDEPRPPEPSDGGMRPPDIQRVEVTLPDIECDNCTLQVIQVMYDKPEYTLPGNDIYYMCADLVLRRGASDGGTGTGSDASVGSDHGAPHTEDDSGSSTTEGDRSAAHLDGGAGSTRSTATSGGCSLAREAAAPGGSFSVLVVAWLVLHGRRRRGVG